MTLQERLEGTTLIGENAEKIESLKKSELKIDRLLAYMMSGRPVTGAIMVEKFHIYSYRDAIFSLKKKGYDISRKDVHEKKSDHIVWWLSDFSEDFVMERIETLW